MSEWIKGEFPKQSGNYAVRYDGVEGRDDFTTNGNHWWNTGSKDRQKDVEWRPDSFREL